MFETDQLTHADPAQTGQRLRKMPSDLVRGVRVRPQRQRNATFRQCRDDLPAGQEFTRRTVPSRGVDFHRHAGGQQVGNQRLDVAQQAALRTPAHFLGQIKVCDHVTKTLADHFPELVKIQLADLVDAPL